MTSSDRIPSGATAPEGVHDHQFDDVPVSSRRRWPWDPTPVDYQRLVANPFLAMVGLIVWFALCRSALRSARLGLVLPALASVFLLVFLLQYHCLDCGRTGRLFRWRDHACTQVVTRQVTGRPRRFRGPSPIVQTFLWFFAMVFLASLWLLASI